MAIRLQVHMNFSVSDKLRIFISMMLISSPNPMFDHLLESSHRDDSNKWSNIGFGQEIPNLVLIVVCFTHLIWSSALYYVFFRVGSCGANQAVSSEAYVLFYELASGGSQSRL